MKISRRELGAVAVAAVVAPSAEPQTPAPQPDLAQSVRDANRRNAETLAKFEIPIATEPAFEFKA